MPITRLPLLYVAAEGDKAVRTVELAQFGALFRLQHARPELVVLIASYNAAPYHLHWLRPETRVFRHANIYHRRIVTWQAQVAVYEWFHHPIYGELGSHRRT